ncbi:MAG: ABC transporter permease [Bacteroidota bacterium]
MTLAENIKISFTSIKGNMLRAVITALIISIGITALVGILTAIDGIKSSINKNFSNMGANTFNIKNPGGGRARRQHGRSVTTYELIKKEEAISFVNEFNYPGTSSISANASFASTIKFQSNKTEPNVMVMGGDENYLKVSGYDIELGRNFSAREAKAATNICIIGKEIKTKLFKNNKMPVGESIMVGAAKYRVVGVLKERGNASGFGGDRLVIIPVMNAYQVFNKGNMSAVITVAVDDVSKMNMATEDAKGLFRRIRGLKAYEDDNFEIYKADNIANELLDQLQYFTLAATIIGFITLLGAAVGLMNIMLVSVTERTREIGIRKALGATKGAIKSQFLIEAIVICQLGGLGGIILGISIGNIVSSFVGGGFIIPWLWVTGGILLCVLVGVVSGIYPAIKASKLDPIEALRFE